VPGRVPVLGRAGISLSGSPPPARPTPRRSARGAAYALARPRRQRSPPRGRSGRARPPATAPLGPGLPTGRRGLRWSAGRHPHRRCAVELRSHPVGPGRDRRRLPSHRRSGGLARHPRPRLRRLRRPKLLFRGRSVVGMPMSGPRLLSVDGGAVAEVVVGDADGEGRVHVLVPGVVGVHDDQRAEVAGRQAAGGGDEDVIVA
jgi:hypothetical protein